MTTVAAVMARSYTPDMFDDLAVVDGVTVPHVRSWDKQTGVTSLTFDADLDAAMVAAIRDRMTSRNDADQADRAMLRDAASAGAINLAVMHLAYTLGDPIPAPVLPQT